MNATRAQKRTPAVSPERETAPHDYVARHQMMFIPSSQPKDWYGVANVVVAHHFVGSDGASRHLRVGTFSS